MRGARPPAALRVATFNLHANVDGWGRPFDPLAACCDVDADVLVLVEHFWPDEHGADEGAGALVRRLEDVGYSLAGAARLGRVELLYPPPLRRASAARWGPRRRGAAGLRIIDRAPARRRRSTWRVRAQGDWGLALLTRLPVRAGAVIPLTPLARDRVRRALVRAEVETPAGTVVVCAAHLPHLSAGAPARLGELRRALPEPDVPGVLLGDLNFFGPPLELALAGWRRAVRGRTWPAWHPVAQPDHVFVTRAVPRAHGEVLAPNGSDHRGVSALIELG